MFLICSVDASNSEEEVIDMNGEEEMEEMETNEAANFPEITVQQLNGGTYVNFLNNYSILSTLR